MRKVNTIKRTKQYQSKLEKWIEERMDAHTGKPDYRDFPTNKKKDILLILKPTELYTPYIKNREYSWVGYERFKKVGHLKNTSAEVLGFGDIRYYCPWEYDLKIKCIDNKMRYTGAYSPGLQICDFVFIPHPKELESFKSIMKHISNKPKHLESKLEEYYANL